jgi:IclR family KDG regulon transcriptional repressor
MASDRDAVQSVRRAFEILELLRTRDKGIGVSEMAGLLRLSTTTTHRLLQTLIDCHAVHQDPETRLYDLNSHLLLYGKAVLNRFSFLRSVHPILGDLSKRVEETVFMGILDDEFDLVYIDQVDTLDHPLRMTPQIGLRQPAHCTSLGKVLLAHLPEAKLEMYLKRGKFAQMTKNTITSASALRKELERVQKAGFATDQEEMEIGICCVAAPIQGTNGTSAAVSISGPSVRLRAKGLGTTLSEEVRSTAGRLSELIQHMQLGG